MADVRAQLRAFALSLPGTAEDFPWGERVAKVNGKVFVFLGHDEETGPPLMTVKLVESHGHALALEGAGPTGYGLGRAGWVTVPLLAEGVTLDLLRDWIGPRMHREARASRYCRLERGNKRAPPCTGTGR
jgi:predicted DNA-binding protein (MmcQ/YjbR family)